MANLRAIRTRIKSVENTRQITKSMKMVSASKLRKTQAAFGNLRTFSERCAEMLEEVSAGVQPCDSPFLQPRNHPGAVCYVLIVGNRGLCGTFNNSLLRYLEEQARQESREQFLVVCGRWGKDMIAGTGLRVEKTFEISDTPTAAEARALSAWLRQLYLDGRAEEVVLVYQHYRSVLSQVPARKTLLPLPKKGDAGRECRFLFEPDRESVLKRLIDLYIDNTVHSVLLESRTGEHSARMTAMTSASDNTDELIGKLTLQLNHARQAAITTEISEIVGGADALKNKQ